MADATETVALLSAQRALGRDRMNYDDLDPGIRDTVRLLNDAGFLTADSGDGVSKPADWFESGDAMRVPTVSGPSTPAQMVSDAEQVAALLGDGWDVQASYSTRDQHALWIAIKDAA